jgi:HAE1 family hydrophobic/amphiphilic exporter-1
MDIDLKHLDEPEDEADFSSVDSNLKTTDHLYLQKLEFRPELRKSWLNFFIVNFRVVILLMIILTGVGLYSFFTLPRESNPEVKIPYGIVITTYPGASPSDVEELVTKKIETSLAGLKDVKTITSNSSNSVSSITVEFDAQANLDDSIRNLRDQVNSVQGNLPSDANQSVVKAISFDDTPIWTFSIAGPYDGFTLRQAGDDIQTELEKIPGIREVNVSGGDEKEFDINYDPQKLTFYNLTPVAANQAVAALNIAVPAGNFDGEKYSYSVRSDSRFYDAATLGNVPLAHTDSGAIIYLKDVAEVEETAIKKTVYSRLSTAGQAPQANVTLQVIKKTGGNIIDTIDAGKQVVASELKKLPAGITYSTTVDMSAQINKDFAQLTHDFLLTILLVFLILFLIVGFKEALVAGLAVPLVFFATFGVMLYTGITLNFLSLFSLILSLGLLVDDAIVVVSATKQYMKTGKFTPEEAVLLVLNDFKAVLTTTTLTTVWAFLPLLMASGIIGEFIKSIPITVSVTLISSLIIALIVNHPLAAVLERVRLSRQLFFFWFFLLLGAAVASGVWLGTIGIIVALVILGIDIVLVRWYLKGGRKKLISNEQLVAAEWRDDNLIKKKLINQSRHDREGFLNKLIHGVIRFDKLLPIYEKYLRKILATKKSRWTLLSIVGLLFVAAMALPATGLLASEFFPASDQDTINVSIEAPNGLKLDETNKIVSAVETKLLKYKEIDNFSTIVGQASADSALSVGSSLSNQATITIKLKPEAERKLKSYDIANEINADVSGIQGATIKAESLKAGPPSGAAFEAQISGDDLQVLDKIAHDLDPYLKSIGDVVTTDISMKESPADYTFKLDPARLELYNLNAAYVGSTLRMAISGTKVTTVIIGGKEIDVMARFEPDKIPDLASIQNLQILNLKGQPVFLKDVAQIELDPSIATITHINQKRTVTLTAVLKGGANSTAVVKAFQDKIKQYQFPSGYSITYGGETEQNQESVMSILQAMIVSILLIISTLVIQFNSFRKSIIVLVTIPLALIGVFFGLALAGITLSFPGLIGILALFGIVVKNAIILVDKINLNLKSGIGFTDSIVDAGKSRLEAIFITSICTILGIIPITMSNDMWRALGSAIIFGLLLSSFLTLFVVPTMFMTFIKDRDQA